MTPTACPNCRRTVRASAAKFCPACGAAMSGTSEPAPPLVEGPAEEISVGLDEVTPAKCGLFVGLVAVRESTGPRLGRVAHLTLARMPDPVATVTLFLGDHATYRADARPRYRVMLTGLYSDYVRLRVTPLIEDKREA
jgi:hypothetical protein